VRKALEEPGNGRVLVVDAGASLRCAVLGDNLAENAQRNGWAVRGQGLLWLRGGAFVCRARLLLCRGFVEVYVPFCCPSACNNQLSTPSPPPFPPKIKQNQPPTHLKKGIIVNGCIRDSATIATLLNLGVKALATHPLKSSKRDPGLRDVSVSFAGVSIKPGDWVYADSDGLLVSPDELQL
jgi:hypothetical protein